MTRCLIVRPQLADQAAGGDAVVYRRLESYLARRAAVDVLELAPISRTAQVVNVAKGIPPEAARYAGARNRAALAERLARARYDAVLFAHEAAFPLADGPMPAGARKILYAHNAQSLIASTDNSPTGRLLRMLAVAFDRRWFGDGGADVICISRADLLGLRRIGVDRADLRVAPPGAPPSVALTARPGVIPELVLTGSYAWWRKRRDLLRFAARPPLAYPILTDNETALAALGGQARAVGPAGIDWSAGLRFALITDRFQGGFKLKSLEYVALNGLILSFCDLSAEFEGLPHAGEFVRRVASKAQVAAEISAVMAQPPAEVLARFAAFKAACLARYEWDRCLQPLGEAVDSAAAQDSSGEPSAPAGS